jgi:hypothetical protein
MRMRIWYPAEELMLSKYSRHNSIPIPSRLLSLAQRQEISPITFTYAYAVQPNSGTSHLSLHLTGLSNV